MIALLDVDVLIALLDEAHVHHAPAHAWLAAHRSRGWATCPISQNGCVRVMSQAKYPGALPAHEIARRLRTAVRAADHAFWADSVSLCDPRRFALDRVLTPRHLTDVYLLGLAVANGGRLATFDRTISPSAVVGAKSKHIVIPS